MIATLTARDFDVLGHVVLDITPEKRYQTIERRLTRTKTLDGSAVINDGGHSASDQVIEFVWPNDDSAVHEAVQRLVRLHPLLIVSTVQGLYLAAPERYVPGHKECRLRLLVSEKLST